MNFQTYSDELIARTLLPFIPRRISPNQVTWLRIFALPFIFYLLAAGHYSTGFAIFMLAALTDALDGTMARKRGQITELGKVLDPIADRCLIALVAIIFIPTYFGWALLVTLALLEIIAAAFAYQSKIKLGINPGANWAGKIKMLCQCIAFCMIFIAVLLHSPPWLASAYALLLLSLAFAASEAVVYLFAR